MLNWTVLALGQLLQSIITMTNNLTDQPYHLIYWLRNEYIYFKLHCVLTWIHYFTVYWRYIMLHKARYWYKTMCTYSNLGKKKSHLLPVYLGAGIKIEVVVEIMSVSVKLLFIVIIWTFYLKSRITTFNMYNWLWHICTLLSECLSWQSHFKSLLLPKWHILV